MKTILRVIALTLALNFLALAGGVGWLWQSGKLDKAKVAQIREVLFAADGPATRPATQPSDTASGDLPRAPNLEEMLAKTSGKSAAEQLQYIRTSFDTQMAQLDHLRKQLLALQQQVKLAQDQVLLDRKKLQEEKLVLARREQEAQRLANDKGFQDSLGLYESMPTKQVKTIFMGMDDAGMLRYLQAMEPAKAARIVKEFKTPEETERLKKVMEKMRQPESVAKE